MTEYSISFYAADEVLYAPILCAKESKNSLWLRATCMQCDECNTCLL